MTTDLLGIVGSVLDEQFRVDAIVDEGELTLMYAGHNLADDEPVAIRCLNVPTTLDPALTAPFIRSFEARTRLDLELAAGHSCFVQTIAHGNTVARKTRMTVAYEVREWLDGSTFAAYRTKRRAESAGPWPIEFVLKLLEPVATGLAYLHAQGRVHCEVNPNNLLVVEEQGNPTVKLLDTGEGRVANGTSEPVSVLRVLMPAYTAPEQVDRQVGTVGAWTDVFSLAVIVIECLAGGLGTEKAAAVVVIDPENRPSPQKLGLSLPPNLESVLEQALSLEPARRQADAATFWRELEAAAIWVPADDVASTRIKVSPAKLVESVGLRVAPPPPPPPKAPGNRLVKGTLVGLQPTGPLQRPNRPVTPPPDDAILNTDEVTVKVDPSEALAHDARARPAEAVEPEPVRADLPLAEVPGPPPAEVEPSVFLPPLGRLPMAVRLRLAAIRGGQKSAAWWGGLRSWIGTRAWPWIVVRARDTTPRARALFAASAFVVLLLLALAVMAAVAVAHRGANVEVLPVAPRSPSGSASAEASAREAPAAPQEPVIEFSEQAPDAQPEVAPAFIRKAAAAALDAAGRDMAECEALGELRGRGSIRATFGRNGIVTRIHIGPPYADTPEGACFLDRFGRAQMAPFRGPAGTVNYTFDVPQ